MNNVSFPGLGIEFKINRVMFTIGSIDVYWYGFIIGVAITVCYLLAIKQCKKNKFSSDLIIDLFLVMAPCSVIGARAYYVACDWANYKNNWKSVFDIRSGGLAVYGGVVLTIIAIIIMCKIRKIPMDTVLDYGIVYLPLGQAIGRWGNFFNQEAFGTTTNLPWGMTSETVKNFLANKYPTMDYNLPVHPTFLYESILNFILFFVLLIVRKNSKHRYETFSMYCIVYGCARFFLEGLRTDSLYIGNTGIRTSQLLSGILVVIGFVLIFVSRYKGLERRSLPEKFFISKTKVSKAKVKGEKN